MKIFIFLVILLCTQRAAFTQAAVDTTSVRWNPGYLDIHHIYTGRGNSAFFAMPDGTTMLVDAGDIEDSASIKIAPLTVTPPYPDNSKNSGEWIVDYIKQVFPDKKNIVLNYAIITHFHGDHMGVVNSKTKTAANGKYKLTGITQVGDLLLIQKLIDRDYPYYNFPVDLKKNYRGAENAFQNLEHFIAYKKLNDRLQIESLKTGSVEQIHLKYEREKYPEFMVRGIKRNGTIWAGKDDQIIIYFTKDSMLNTSRKFNENPLSLGLKVSYGPFDYYTGGDNTGLQGYGLPQWHDTETPMAKALGKIEAMSLNHHGNRDATNETFLKQLQPKVIVQQAWCSDHPGQEVMHRLLSNHIYSGEKNIFATGIQDVTKSVLGFWFTQGYKNMLGHVIIRVLPGGQKFYVLIAETVTEKVIVTKVFGPYKSE